MPLGSCDIGSRLYVAQSPNGIAMRSKYTIDDHGVPCSALFAMFWISLASRIPHEHFGIGTGGKLYPPHVGGAASEVCMDIPAPQQR
jgi:hypothetical protein